MNNGGDGVLPVDQNDGEQPSNINISDVIDAITKADPLYGVGVVAMPRPPALHQGPYVRIVEQPASKALRFRYECEGRSAGSIPGVNSKQERKTYPTIEICGHKGQAIIVVSCVTRDEPFKPHPHNLVGRERCENGVCTVKTNITDENPQVSFSNLGIQCVKRKDIGEALKNREKLRVDPFKTGFSHRTQPQSIDLNAVRICFQVFLQDERSSKIRYSLPPVVSDVIYDKKAMSDLLIMRLSQCSASAKGGTEIILLCEKVTREDINVVFFEKRGDVVVWEESANIVLVHRQVAIAFHAPPYHDPTTTDHVQVYLQLKRSSDKACSNAVPFEYIPEHQDPSYLKHKRQKTISPFVHQYDQERNFMDQHIKAEPRDKTPPHQMNSPLQAFSPTYSEHEQGPKPQYQQWANQGGLQHLGGTMHMNYGQDMQWTQNYAQLSNMQPVSPMQAVSPLQAMPTPSYSPNMQTMSPNVQTLSPNVQVLSPIMQMSPVGRISPMTHGVMSPNMSQMSPNMSQMSPNMGHVSPSLGHISSNIQQMPQEIMETGVSETPSLTGLLMDRVEASFNSGELSGLANYLERPTTLDSSSGLSSGLANYLGRSPDLSDSLNRLSTSDLLP